MSDDELKEFYEKNKEMVDRIISERVKERHDEIVKSVAKKIAEYEDRNYKLITSTLEDPEKMKIKASEYYEKYKKTIEDEIEDQYQQEERFRERAKNHFDDSFREHFGFLQDPSFQKHALAAGLEAFAAINAMLKQAPLPDSVKETIESMSITKDREFCKNNPNCPVKNESKNSSEKKKQSGPVEIKVKQKETSKSE